MAFCAWIRTCSTSGGMNLVLAMLLCGGTGKEGGSNDPSDKRHCGDCGQSRASIDRRTHEARLTVYNCHPERSASRNHFPFIPSSAEPKDPHAVCHNDVAERRSHENVVIPKSGSLLLHGDANVLVRTPWEMHGLVHILGVLRLHPSLLRPTPATATPAVAGDPGRRSGFAQDDRRTHY